MEAVRLAQRKKGDEIQGFLAVKQAQVRTSATGSRFLDITLMDATGEMNGKGWDWGDVAPPADGSVIKIKAMVTEYKERLQMRVDRIRAALPEEVIWEDLVPCAPEAPGDMYAQIHTIAAALPDADYAKLTVRMLEMHHEQLLIWPAALAYHHAERSGLLYHTLSIARAALAILPIYPFLDKSLLLCGIVMHDLNKVEELCATQQGLSTGYSTKGLLLGHITGGVQQVGEIGKELELPEEKVLLVQHMILSHHNEPDFGSPRRPMFPEAEMLHHLDNIDARMYQMRHALKDVQPGGFSDRVRPLNDRKLYKRITDLPEGS